jgi:zinc protease
MLTAHFPIRSAIAALALTIASAAACAETVAQRSLTNGMTILVKEDHRSPVVVSMVWYRVGSMDEVSGTTGVAHMLEHMMFKGTELPVGEFSRTIARAGGGKCVHIPRLHGLLPAAANQLPWHWSWRPIMVNLAFADEEFAKGIQSVMRAARARMTTRIRNC